VQTKKRRRRSGLPQERGVKRRQKLISAASSLLGHQSFQDITYQSIADEAGVPLASCYHFYKSKLDLVRVLADELTETYLEVVFDLKLYREARTWQECINSYIMASVDHHNQSTAELQIFFSGDVPLTLRQDALEREKRIGLQLLGVLGEKFDMPVVEDAGNILFRAVEIARTVLALEYQESGGLTNAAATEAVRAVTGYLSNYLPPVLVLAGR
jgi:AcrR family transcriptional regulator